MIRRLIILLLIVGCEDFAPTNHTHTDTGETFTDTLFVYDTLIVTNYDTLIITNYDTTIVYDTLIITNYDTLIVLDTLVIEQMDCNGVQGGNAQYDNCGVCDSDLSNDCVPDCAGVWGGVSVEDECGVCIGYYGANADMDCAGECFGEAQLDACGFCGGTCDISCDACGVCGGDNSTCPTISDIDGNVYEIIMIGEQWWMKENLKTIHYNNGEEIQLKMTGSEGSSDEGQYGIYNNNPSNADIYGNLYNWVVIDDERGICPEGFHVPSDEEWSIFITYLDEDAYMWDEGSGSNYWHLQSHIAGGLMKSIGTIQSANGLWFEPNFGAINESGFTALPSGTGVFWGTWVSFGLGIEGTFWSSSEHSHGLSAWVRFLHTSNSEVWRGLRVKSDANSIRCLKD